MFKVTISWGLMAMVMATLPAAQARADQATASAGKGNEGYTQAEVDAFRTTYRAKFIDACVTSGAKGSGRDFTAACACVADELLRTKSIDELVALGNDTDNPIYTQLAKQCLAAHPAVRQSG